MADAGGKPLEGVTASLADRAFATRVAGWWLAALGADVGDAAAEPSDAEHVDEVPDVVQRFLGRDVGARGTDRQGDGRGDEVDVVIGGDRRQAGAATGRVLRSDGPGSREGIGAEQAMWAECGLADITRELRGHAGSGDPCVPSNRQPSILTGTAMALAAMAGRVGHVLGIDTTTVAEVDPRALLVLLPMQPLARAQLASGPSVPATSVPGGVFEAADGLVYARPVEPDHWRVLLAQVPGLSEAGDGPFLGRDPRVVDDALAGWIRGQRRDDLVGDLQDRHVPMAPVRSVGEVLDDAHLQARGFVSPGRDPELRPPWVVLAEGRGKAPLPVGGAATDGPLCGIRVLDLTWAWAGPFATRLLADLGAEVVNVEWFPRASNLRTQAPFAPRHDGSPNAGGWWSANQRGKKSIGINLKHPEGRALVLAIAETCHLTMENFAAGVVERLGVAYDDVVRSNPAMVYVSMSGWGRGGPSEHWIGYGTHVQAAAGADLAMPGPSGRPSHMLIPYADPVSGLCAAVGAVAYLYAALATGRSAHLDVSELECMALTLLEPLLQAASGDSPARYPYSVSGEAGSIVLRPYGSAAEEAGIPVQTMREVLDDPRFADLWMEDRSEEIVGTGTRIARAPWTLDGRVPDGASGAPTLFADTRPVLREVLGLDDHEIDRLDEAGAIATADRR